MIRQQQLAEEIDPNSRLEDDELVDAVTDVLEQFENDPHAIDFIATIFPNITARARANLLEFDEFMIADLPDIAHLGMEVLNRVQGMPLAEKALTALYIRYLKDEKTFEWKQLFKDATRTAYNLKYMFREDLDIARDKFTRNLDRNLTGKPQQIFRGLVEGAFKLYNGLVDQETLAHTDFLTNPRALIDVSSLRGKWASRRVWAIGVAVETCGGRHVARMSDGRDTSCLVLGRGGPLDLPLPSPCSPEVRLLFGAGCA